MNLKTLDFEGLTIARYEIHLRARNEAMLPPFLGSTLRGAFGHALKAVACSMPQGDCGRCFLIERCLYPKLFETSARNGNAAVTDEMVASGTAVNGAVNGGTGDLAARDGSLGTSSLNAVSSYRTLTNGIQEKRRPASGPGVLLRQRQDAPRPFIFIPPLPANDNGFMRARDDLLRWRVRVRAGEPVVFGLSLIGDAIDDLPYVVYAISLMARHGFGAERASFALERVAALDVQGRRTVIYTTDSNRIEEHASTSLGALVQARLDALPITDCQLPIERSAVAASGITSTVPGAESTLMFAPQIHNPSLAIGSEPTDSPRRYRPLAIDRESTNSQSFNSQSVIREQVTLRFLTPTRMRLKGRVMENPSFAQLISSLSLRLSMLAETFADAPLSYDYKAMIERAHEVTTRDSTLRLMALDRYSNRRGGKLELDGFMGDVTFAGPTVQELLPLLVAGEYLHVGSGTAFGLGRYVIAVS